MYLSHFFDSVLYFGHPWNTPYSFEWWRGRLCINSFALVVQYYTYILIWHYLMDLSNRYECDDPKLINEVFSCGGFLQMAPLHWSQSSGKSARISEISALPYPEPVCTGWSSVHWNATGIPLVDPVYTGVPLGDTANTCRVHWNTTGKNSWNSPTPECRWRNSNFCSLHWNTTGGTVTAHTHPGTYC